MANNVKVRPSSHNNSVNVATNEIGGVHYPVYFDWRLEMSRGEVSGHQFVHKFGSNLSVGTSLAPVCSGGIYQMPTGVAELEVVSSSANDASDGTGAQQVTLEYLDANFVEQTATLDMNGVSAGSVTVTGVKRLYRLYVARSGAYATQSTPSQIGAITVREAGGGATWATIPTIATGFGAGQSLIGCYTVPAGKTAYILTQSISIDSGKTANVYFFKRQNSDDTTAPYSGVLRVQNLWVGLSNATAGEKHETLESYPEKTDMGFLAAVEAGSAGASVEFEILLVNN